MGINAAFSSWLRGAQSFATTTLRTAQGYGAALQAQTMTAVSAAQRAAVQPIQQVLQPRPSTRPTSSSPHTARTLTPVDAVSRAVSGGVQGVQEAARQIVRAHAPIVQGVQRDIGRATQALPQAARSAPAAIQQGATQIARAHSPIMQGIQRDVGRAAQAIPAVSQIARAHAPIAQGLQRDAARVVSGGLGAATSAMNFANQRKAAAQAELTRTAGPAAPFEKGWTHPVYEWGREANKAYQGFVDTALPLYQRVQPLPNLPEIHSLQRGFARAPGSLLEGLSFIPPAAERGGQLLWKEPHKLPETAAKFAGQQIEGLGAAYERDPYDFAGEMIGTVALSYGIGAAARPGAVARGSGATASATRTARGGPRSPGGAGGRFKALEFGYQTKQIPKPVLETKPFRLSDWQKERQRYARPRTVVPVQASPTLPAQLQATIPVPTPRMVYISSGVAGFAARQGSRVPLAPAPQDALLDVAFAQREINQDTILNLGTLHPVRPALLDQDVATREKERLALVLVPLMTRPQTQDQALVTVPRPTEDRKITDPPKRRRPPVIPLYLLPPRSSTPRGKDKKKKGEDERRRRKKKGEADHWELGPAPGTTEMAAMIFGAPGGRSVLNLGGGSPLSFGFAARPPAPPVIPSFGPTRPPAKKPAHAGKLPAKKRNGAKKKK